MLISFLSKSLGDEFLSSFGKLAPHIFDYLTDRHAKYDKLDAIYCITNVFDSCNSAIPMYFLQFVYTIEENGKSNDSRMNRNIAWAIGILA